MVILTLGLERLSRLCLCTKKNHRKFKVLLKSFIYHSYLNGSGTPHKSRCSAYLLRIKNSRYCSISKGPHAQLLQSPVSGMVNPHFGHFGFVLCRLVCGVQSNTMKSQKSHLRQWKSGPVLLKVTTSTLHYFIRTISEFCLKIFCLKKSLKINYGFLFFLRVTWYICVGVGVIRGFCVRARITISLSTGSAKQSFYVNFFVDFLSSLFAGSKYRLH